MFSYSFPAVAGIQSNKQYYIAMIPLSLLRKLFSSYEECDMPPEFRAQRRLNEARIPEIRNYILSNRDSYVFSALTASIDGKFEFTGDETGVGILAIDMSASLLINDGQHRKAAIEEALMEDPSLGDETISVVFFKDEGLQRSQQMFTDLNKHAVKSSNSLATLYDTRDWLSVSTKEVVQRVPVLKRFTDLEHDILGKNSMHFFTLNSMKKANARIIRSKESDSDVTDFLVKYWATVFSNIDEWQDVMNKRITKKDLRESYILSLSITMNAFGKLGEYFYSHRDVDMTEILKGLKQIDWLRSASGNWEDRLIRRNGKIINTEESVTLTCSKIKMLLGIELSREELNKERNFRSKNVK